MLYVQGILTLIVRVNTVLPRHYAPPYFRMNFQYRTILPPLHAFHGLLELVYGLQFMYVYACCKCVKRASVHKSSEGLRYQPKTGPRIEQEV